MHAYMHAYVHAHMPYLIALHAYVTSLSNFHPLRGLFCVLMRLS